MTQLGCREVGNSYMTKTNNNVLPCCLGNKVKIRGKLQQICVVFFNLLKLKWKMVTLHSQSKFFSQTTSGLKNSHFSFHSYKRRGKFSLGRSFSHVGAHKELKRKQKALLTAQAYIPCDATVRKPTWDFVFMPLKLISSDSCVWETCQHKRAVGEEEKENSEQTCQANLRKEAQC